MWRRIESVPRAYVEMVAIEPRTKGTNSQVMVENGRVYTTWGASGGVILPNH